MSRPAWLLHLLIGFLIGAGIARCGAAGAAEIGQVSFFNLAACPENWGAVSAPGRFLIATGTLGTDTYALAATGGSARVQLITSHLPNHTHGIKHWHTAGAGGLTNIFVVTGGGSLTAANNSVNTTTQSNGAGSDQPHENRPPYLALTLCQRTAEDDLAMDFWPELSMASAMEIAGAALVLFALAWGLSVVVRFTINQR